jgi:hypothetical protein
MARDDNKRDVPNGLVWRKKVWSLSRNCGRPLQNCIKPVILSFRRKSFDFALDHESVEWPESSIIKYFLDSPVSGTGQAKSSPE